MSNIVRIAALLLCAGYGSAAEFRVGRASVDDSAVKALVLDDGDTRAALVICDLLLVDEATVLTARKQIAEQSAVPEANVMISATGVRTARTSILPARISEAVRKALATLQPASVWAGSGKDDAIGFYNRFLMKDGTVRANPGRLNPAIVQPAGEADPDLTIALFETAAGGAIAIYGSFSLHSDTLDYLAPIGRTLSKIYGADLLTLWSPGAGGNVSNIDVRSHLAPYPPGVEARRVGSIIAGETIKAVARSVRVESPKLRIAREVVKLASLHQGPPVEAEVQVISLGGALAFVGLPGELWTELGLAIRKASPFPGTLLVGFSNGSAGTLPTRKGYSAGDAESEVRTAAGSGETVANTAVRLLAAARRQAGRQ